MDFLSLLYVYSLHLIYLSCFRAKENKKQKKTKKKKAINGRYITCPERSMVDIPFQVLPTEAFEQALRLILHFPSSLGTTKIHEGDYNST